MFYDDLFQKAIKLQNEGALQQAEDIYLQLLQVMPQNSDIWNLLGLIAQSKGNLIHARDCFLSAIKYAPMPFFAHFFNLGLIYKSLNKNKEAKDAFIKSVELKNDFAVGWQQLGLLHMKEGEYHEGIASLKKALDFEPNSVDVLADLYFYTKEYEELWNLADKNKNNYEAQYRAGLLTDDPIKKECFFKQAILDAPERTDAVLSLAQLKKEKKENADALNLYFKVLNLDDKNIEAILGVADIYLDEKKFDEAEKYYQRSFDISRDIVGAHINYGALLYQQNRLSEALEEYRYAVSLEPEKSELSFNLALVLKEVGDFDEALGLMFNAYLKEQNNEIFSLNIMETLTELASTDAQKALKIAQNWYNHNPNNPYAVKIYDALTSNANAAHDVVYAEHLFDQFADTYENVLSKLLPQIIDKFAQLYAPVYGKILDLGCGTGLVAEKLKNENNIFDGVDLSSQMIDIAKKKGIYRQIYKGDLVSFLQQKISMDYDYFLAFDVFCYLGELSPIFESIKHGIIAFSVELACDTEKGPYYATATGRYKHTKNYIEEVLRNNSFTNIEVHELCLRQEKGKDVDGLLVYALKLNL